MDHLAPAKTTGNSRNSSFQNQDVSKPIKVIRVTTPNSMHQAFQRNTHTLIMLDQTTLNLCLKKRKRRDNKYKKSFVQEGGGRVGGVFQKLF